ncbi:hypothetical protein M378DRAFT_173793 [Amanita muscaria Koide BX008]|uniref:Uncharacterized protein n=1 Tax=Amanita muscaria (strain Koide BX008) TaxID=946122 RepID=A0A0C2WGJ9_AMAMK|nr:hypothetical protein M378DRAFT_173793 [Amanita muscaria Koide BX008]
MGAQSSNMLIRSKRAKIANSEKYPIQSSDEEVSKYVIMKMIYTVISTQQYRSAQRFSILTEFDFRASLLSCFLSYINHYMSNSYCYILPHVGLVHSWSNQDQDAQQKTIRSEISVSWPSHSECF